MPKRINFINYPCCHPVDHSNTAKATNKITKAKSSVSGKGEAEKAEAGLWCGKRRTHAA